MWFIGVEVEQETSAPPPKKNPGSALEKQREACAVSRKSCGLHYTNIFQLFLLFTQAAFSCFLCDFSWLLPLILLGICSYNLWLTAPKGMVNRKLGICRGIFGKIR